MLNRKDIAQLQNQNRDIAKVEQQIEYFRKGFPFLSLVRPAVIGDGILKPENDQSRFFSNLFEENLSHIKILKFVPASGAATRMFKSLFAFLDYYNGTPEDHEKLEKDMSQFGVQFRDAYP